MRRRWAGGETYVRRDMHEAGGGKSWEDPARLSVRKIPFLYFPHILHLQMKQKHKVSCHNKEVESTDKEVQLESEKELTETPAAGGEKKKQPADNRLDLQQAGSVCHCSQTQLSRDARKIRTAENLTDWWATEGGHHRTSWSNWNTQKPTTRTVYCHMLFW